MGRAKGETGGLSAPLAQKRCEDVGIEIERTAFEKSEPHASSRRAAAAGSGVSTADSSGLGAGGTRRASRRQDRG